MTNDEFIKGLVEDDTVSIIDSFFDFYAGREFVDWVHVSDDVEQLVSDFCVAEARLNGTPNPESYAINGIFDTVYAAGISAAAAATSRNVFRQVGSLLGVSGDDLERVTTAVYESDLPIPASVGELFNLMARLKDEEEKFFAENKLAC